MDDILVIRDLRLRGIIGINDWEREKRQDILVNITLIGDLRKAGESDKIEDTINYRTVAKKTIAHVEGSERFTVEALATDLAKIALAEAGVNRVEVSVEKPGALRFADSVGVIIERSAGDFD